ncbi:hypothetical protein BKA63DRAFT_26366 [Paraphoma chrysanthemicola]|nr:hypothetical protein BKA63DRAFT_26366 [Paraphoma chrysanthemicola]
MLLQLSLLASLPITVHTTCVGPTDKYNREADNSYPQKRAPQDEFDLHNGPSPISIDLPAEFLPPPWSPDSNLDSPYPSSGVSPWDDSGRSQMTDNQDSIWRTCPQLHLDCRKCPRDFRCRRPQIPAWGDRGNPVGAITTLPDLASSDIPPEDDGNGACPLKKCSTDLAYWNWCYSGARCTRGYCACDVGKKGSWREGGEGYRGNGGLEEVTVYVDPGVFCDIPCDDLSCKEVKQLELGTCWKDGDSNSIDQDEKEKVLPTYDNLETDGVGSGAIHLPSADGIFGSSGDYVAGVADPSAIGEAT